MTLSRSGQAIARDRRSDRPPLRIIAAACFALGLTRFALRAVSTAPSEWRHIGLVVALVSAYWIPASVAIGYFHAWVVRRHFNWRPKFVIHVFAAAIVIVTESLWSQAVVRLTGGVPSPLLKWTFLRLDWNGLIYLLAITGFAAARALRVARARELVATELDAALTDAHLHGLALQLQPHFLFNTLLLIAETAYTDAAVARTTLGALRTLLRTAYAYGGRRVVTVAEEIAFLEAYAAIQQHRFGDRLAVKFKVDPGVERATLPPLLLQPLVENAIRHGICTLGRGGSVQVRATRTANSLDLAIVDDGQGFPHGAALDSGTGLSLTRRRLAGLYGDSAQLLVSALSGGGVEARVTLPFSEDPCDDATLPSPPHVVDDERADDWGNTGDFSVVTAGVEIDADDPLAGADDGAPAGSWSMASRLSAGWVIAIASIIEMHSLGMRFGYYGSSTTMSWQGLFADTIVSVPFWAALTVAAVVINRKAEHRALSPGLTFTLHLLAVATIATAHSLLGARVEALVWWGSRSDLSPGQYYMGATWDILTYALVVGIARREDLAAWASRWLLQARSLRLQVEAAGRRLARLRLQQPLLISALEGIANADGALAIDHASVQFADLVRVLRTTADSDTHTLAAEMLLTEHYAALRTRATGSVTMSRATSEASVSPAIVATVLHTLLTRVDDPASYTIAAEPVGNTLRISVGVTSGVALPDRSAAGDRLQALLDRQLDAACGAGARLTFLEHDRRVQALLEIPFVRPSMDDDSPQCDYLPDDHLCLVMDHRVQVHRVS